MSIIILTTKNAIEINEDFDFFHERIISRIEAGNTFVMVNSIDKKTGATYTTCINISQIVSFTEYK